MVRWDDRKRQTNLKLHGLDFEGCEEVFDNPVLTQEDVRGHFGELRMNLLGWFRGRVVHLTYTERGEEIRVISLREATRHEARTYFEILSQEP